MTSAEIIKTLREQMPLMRQQFSVDQIGLFGSYSRNEQNENSDIDVLVKFNKHELKSLIGLLDFLEARLQKKVDIVTDGKQLSERFKKHVQSEIIYA
jgi:predicted nucleotidyltransferase